MQRRASSWRSWRRGAQQRAEAAAIELVATPLGPAPGHVGAGPADLGDVPQVLLGVEQVDDLDGAGEQLVGDVPDPLRAVAEHHPAAGAVEAVPAGLAVDPPERRQVDVVVPGRGALDGGGVADRAGLALGEFVARGVRRPCPRPRPASLPGCAPSRRPACRRGPRVRHFPTHKHWVSRPIGRFSHIAVREGDAVQYLSRVGLEGLAFGGCTVSRSCRHAALRVFRQQPSSRCARRATGCLMWRMTRDSGPGISRAAASLRPSSRSISATSASVPTPRRHPHFRWRDEVEVVAQKAKASSVTANRDDPAAIRAESRKASGRRCAKTAPPLFRLPTWNLGD